MPNYKYLFCIVFLISASSAAFDYNEKIAQPINITSEVSILKKSNKENMFDENNFSLLKKNNLALSYSNQTYWFKISLNNILNQSADIVLYIDTPLGNHAEILTRDKNLKLRSIGISGSGNRYNSNSFPSMYTAFKIHLSPNSKKDYYIKRFGHHRLDGKFYVSEINQFKQTQYSKALILYIYLGSFISLLIYNFFIGIYTKQKSYFLYTGFIFFFGMTIITIQGLTDNIFQYYFSVSNYLLMFTASAAAFGTMFVYHFLDVEKYYPRTKKFYQALIIICAAQVILFPILNPFIGATLGILIDLTIPIIVICMFVAGFATLKRGNIMSRFFMSSWAALFAGIIIWYAMYAEIVPQNILTRNSLLWGNLLEMLILSLGLAYQIVILDKQKKEIEFKAKEGDKIKMLLRVVLHDIANPLSIVMAYTSLIKKNNLDQRNEKNWEKVSRAANFISSIIKSIRNQDVHKADAFTGNFQSVDLKEAIEDSLFIFHKRIEDKNLKISVQVENIVVLADRTLLINNVFSNALSNAIKFSPPNGTITIECIQLQNITTLNIIDSGAGLSNKRIENFNQEGRLKSTIGTSGESGTGYGMMLMKTYMELFNGSIEISSPKSNKGTVVSLIFGKDSHL